VGAADRLALRPPALEVGLVEDVAEAAQGVGHGLGPVLAVLTPRVQPAAQCRVLVIDQVPEHVQVLLVAVHGGDLDRRHQAKPEPGRGLGGGRDAVDRVVVAQREQLHAGLRRRGHHIRRLKRAVGVQRMALQIEGRRFDAQAPRG